MAKKKKKSYYSYQVGNGKKKKGKGKGKKSAYSEPRIKSVKPSLSGKEGKKNAKIIRNPVEVPKEFAKRRCRCNHADGLLTVEEFRNMSMTATAYTPALERVVEQYGEDHVHICARCFDVVVDRSEITHDETYDALTTLYVACNTAVANSRLKEDEIKAIAKLKNVITDFDPVLDILAKAEAAAAAEPSGGASAANLNTVTNGTLVV